MSNLNTNINTNINKKIAILLFGISKLKYYKHFTNEIYEINYEYSIENYEKYIFQYFKDLNYDIDLYFCSNIISNTEQKKILELYNPKQHKFINDLKNNIESRNIKLSNVIELCLNSKIKYDTIFITRFDLLFKINFSESNINLNKFNLVSKLEKENLICDNFYLFPYKFLYKFYNIIKNNIIISNHNILNLLEENFNINNINYIYNENLHVADLTFYKINRIKSYIPKYLIILYGNSNSKISWHQCYNSIQDNIFNYFKFNNYNYKICIHTNNSIYSDSLINTIKSNNNNNSILSILYNNNEFKTKKLNDFIYKTLSNFDNIYYYDYIIILQLDIIYKLSFNNLIIDNNKINKLFINSENEFYYLNSNNLNKLLDISDYKDCIYNIYNEKHDNNNNPFYIK